MSRRSSDKKEDGWADGEVVVELAEPEWFMVLMCKVGIAGYVDLQMSPRLLMRGEMMNRYTAV